MSDIEIKKKRKRRPPAKKPGPKVGLTLELLTKIKDLVIEGYTDVKIQTTLKIPKGTWDHWKYQNIENFADKLTQYDLLYQLSLAKQNLREVLKMETKEPVIGMFGPVVDKKTKKPVIRQNDRLLKIKSDVAIFVTETVGKAEYSKKQPLEDIDESIMIILKK